METASITQNTSPTIGAETQQVKTNGSFLDIMDQMIQRYQNLTPQSSQNPISSEDPVKAIARMGLMEYVFQLHVEKLRAQIREEVIADLKVNGLTGKTLKTLLNDSRLPQAMRDKLEKAIEREVERRLKNHLLAEKKAGMYLSDTRKTDTDNIDEQEQEAKNLSEIRKDIDGLVQYAHDVLKENLDLSS